MGQPKKTPEKLRRHSVKVSLNDAELEQLKEKSQGRSLGTYCRESALNKVTPVAPLQAIPEVNREKWMELGRLGSNLNQIARQLNAGEFVQAQEIQEVIENTWAEVQKLRQELKAL